MTVWTPGLKCLLRLHLKLSNAEKFNFSECKNESENIRFVFHYNIKLQQAGHIYRNISYSIFKFQIFDINDISVLDLNRIFLYEIVK